MPIVDYKKYVAMLEKARQEHYAYPAINITTTDTLNAAIEGLPPQRVMELFRFQQAEARMPQEI